MKSMEIVMSQKSARSKPAWMPPSIDVTGYTHHTALHNRSLVTTRHSAGPQHRVKAYRSMLEVALSDGQVTASERRLLETFRERHAIADKDHEEGLRAAGWSVDEYARGRRSRLLMWGRSSPSA